MITVFRRGRSRKRSRTVERKKKGKERIQTNTIKIDVHEIIGHQLFVSAHVSTNVVNASANPPSASVQTVIVVVRVNTV